MLVAGLFSLSLLEQATDGTVFYLIFISVVRFFLGGG